MDGSFVSLFALGLRQFICSKTRPHSIEAAAAVNGFVAARLEMWKDGFMQIETSETLANRPAEAVIQFSVFMPNRVGRLSELVSLLAAHDVHVLALTILDTTDSSIIRVVVDDPDKGRELLGQHHFAFTESEPLVVALDAADEMNRLISALLEAELNINYLYSFIPHPNGKSILGLSMEDNEMAEKVLKQHQFAVLKQGDLAR